jgi:drug/metabolite transporter (DMT)-like permease
MASAAPRRRRQQHNAAMSASWLVVFASFLFATMGVCVKLASAHYGSGEIVMYRGLIGALMIGAVCRWRGESLRTALPAQHFLRSLTGVVALCLWFYAIGKLPLATAMTLNYTSSLWLALFLLGGAMVLRTQPVDARLVVAALAGFVGVVLVLRGGTAWPACCRAWCRQPVICRWRRWAVPASPRAASFFTSRSVACSAALP